MNERHDAGSPPPELPHRQLSEHVRRASGRATTVVLVAIVLFLYGIRHVLPPFVLAGAAAYACTPVVNRLTARTRLPRVLWAIAVFLLLAGMLALVAELGLPALFAEIANFATDTERMVEDAIRGVIGDRTVLLLGEPMNASQLAKKAVEGVRGWAAQTTEIVTLAAYSFAFVFGTFLTLVILFYFLTGGPQLARGAIRLIPPQQRALIQHIAARIDPVLKRYIIGVVLVVIYAATAAYIGLGLILGLKHAVFLAILTGLLEMIPVIGPLMAAVIAGVVALQAATSVWNIIGYVIYAAALRLSIDQLFGPIVLGQAARMHPVLVIFCFLSGGVLLGVAGVLIAVPVALTIRIVLATLYDEPLSYERPADSDR
jgi:predicted PurR-regulated permease PerM